MQPEEYKSSIAVIGCNKAANEYIAKAVANRLGMRYMDLDGYLKYIMGGISASKALIKADRNFCLKVCARRICRRRSSKEWSLRLPRLSSARVRTT